MAEGLQEEDFGAPSPHLRLNVVGFFFAGLFVLALGAGLFLFKQKRASSDVQILSANASSSSVAEIVVHVDGAVISPGVYHLPSNVRIDDVIGAAGGLSADADQSRINLAAKLTDGQKVHVFAIGEGITSSQGITSTTSLININTASETELDKLPGIGPVTAQKIISSRPYSSSGELLSKKVVTKSVYLKIKDLITL